MASSKLVGIMFLFLPFLFILCSVYNKFLASDLKFINQYMHVNQSTIKKEKFLKGWKKI